jgi:hypothetical protein
MTPIMAIADLCAGCGPSVPGRPLVARPALVASLRSFEAFGLGGALAVHDQRAGALPLFGTLGAVGARVVLRPLGTARAFPRFGAIPGAVHRPLRGTFTGCVSARVPLFAGSSLDLRRELSGFRLPSLSAPDAAFRQDRVGALSPHAEVLLPVRPQSNTGSVACGSTKLSCKAINRSAAA